VPAGLRAEIVHVHFHDTDLVDRTRRRTLVWALRALALRRRPTDLDTLAVAASRSAPEVPFGEVARP